MEIPTIGRTNSTIVVEIVENHIVVLEIRIQDEHVIPLKNIKCVS
jgi:hypothetical protein